jgi:hypothetical protein
MTLPEEDLELLDGAFAEMRAFGAELAEAAGWMPPLFVGLLNSTLREYQHLKLGLKHSTAMVAWACRNLLDLHIYAAYVLASEANAQRILTERLHDGIELADAFQTWLARNDPDLLPPSLEQMLRTLMDQRNDAGLSDTPPLKLKRAAAEVGLSDEHANMMRLTAKLAHPNVHTILIAVEEDEIAGMRAILFRAGAGHGLEIFRGIQDHVRNHPLVQF